MHLRSILSVPGVGESGQASIRLPADLVKEQAGIIAYLQKNNLEISAANLVRL